MFKQPLRLFVLGIGLLLIIILPTNCFAEIIGKQEKALELTLNQAIKMALDQNADFHLASLDLNQAKASYKRAIIINDAELIETATEALETQQQNYEQQRRDLITLVKTTYYDLLQQEASIDDLNKALNRAQSQLELDQAKFKAGIISSLDVLRSENNLLNSEINLKKAKVSLETKYMEFNRELNLDLTLKVKLIEKLAVEFIPFNMSLLEGYELALDFDQTILAANEGLTKAIEAVKAADNPFTPTVDLEKAMVEKEKANIKLEQAKVALYFKIRNDYFNLKNLEEDVHTKARQLQLEQLMLESEEAKYSAGVISNEAIVSQQEKLAQAENAYTQALWTYSQSRSNFLALIGCPEPLWGENHEY